MLSQSYVKKCILIPKADILKVCALIPILLLATCPVQLFLLNI